MVGLSHSGAPLAKAVKELMMSWTRTSSRWHDVARKRFEETYIDELVRAARSAIGAMDTMTAILREAQTKCR